MRARARPRPSFARTATSWPASRSASGAAPAGATSSAALDAALEAAELAATPLMAHIAEGADLRAVLPRLRPGDIVTHAFTASGPGILGDDGRILPEAHDARRRGVRFDVGHGCGSFSWATAAQALAEGLGPDSISTDLHRYSIERPVVDLPTTMSRYLALGLSLGEVVTATTSGPAAILDRPGARHAAPRQSGRCQRAPPRRDAGRAPGFAGGPPDRAHQARPGHDDRGRRPPSRRRRRAPPAPLSRRRPGGRLLGPDLRVGSGVVAQAEPLELDAIGIRVGVEDRADLVPAQRDEVRIAADAARLVEGLRPCRVQLAERRP